MIDGACLLTPGVVRLARVALGAFPQPLVMTRYFYLGPGPQHETVAQGYGPAVEDELLHRIHWPAQGYRLFEIGTPLRATAGRGVWFAKLFESCCLFVPRTLFHAIGGCDERFDLPGGGFLAPDLYRRAATYPGTTVIQLLGEAVFHQVHGGTTTNTSPADRQAKLEQFQRQYRELRGEDFTVAPGRAYSFGHLPREAQRKY